MLENIKQKLQEEETQRAILKAGGVLVTFVAGQIFYGLMNKGIDNGINALMSKLHPTVVETPAE